MTTSEGERAAAQFFNGTNSALAQLLELNTALLQRLERLEERVVHLEQQ